MLTVGKPVAQNYGLEHTTVTPTQLRPLLSNNFWFYLDAVGSTAFHPLMASLLSVSGSRHFVDDDDDDDSSTSDEESTSINNQPTIRRSERSLPVTIDSSIKIWDFRPSGE
jgi:hypothetical protein